MRVCWIAGCCPSLNLRQARRRMRPSRQLHRRKRRRRSTKGVYSSARNFLECHPERRGRRGDRGVEGTLYYEGFRSENFCRPYRTQIDFPLHPALRLRLRAGLNCSAPTALGYRPAHSSGEYHVWFPIHAAKILCCRFNQRSFLAPEILHLKLNLRRQTMVSYTRIRIMFGNPTYTRSQFEVGASQQTLHCCCCI